MTISGIWLGRERELGELEAGLAQLSAGRGGLYLVAGEPGIGKTRLCDELARSAAARGVAVHWGRAWEAGGAPSYWPFTQVLRGVARARGVPAPSLEQFGDRFDLFDAVTTFLHEAAEQGPLVMILDDLHAADPSSVQLLHFLVRDLRARPLMVVGTYREAEARMLLEIGRTLAHVAREAVVLPLRRLDRREVAEYVARATGEVPAADRVAAIFQRSEGNPLFLRELMQLAGAASRAPDGIREVVRARLSLLAPELRALLEHAAVLGREIPIAMLPPGASLAAAADAGIVEPLDAERWRFTHVLLREGLYEAMAPERGAALHREVARLLRLRGGDPAEIAHHVLHAIPLASVGEVVEAALAAAHRAMRLLAFEDAAAMLARVLPLLDGDPRLRFDVLLAMGIAHLRAVQPAEGKQACLRAAELARELGDGELFAHAVLGSAAEFEPGIRDHALIALLEEALVRLPPGESALRARVLVQLAAERQPEPRTDESIAATHEAIAMARRSGDREALLLAIANGSLTLMFCGDPDEVLALGREGLALAQTLADQVQTMRLHLVCALACGRRGDLAGKEAHALAYEALIEGRPTPRRRAVAGSFRAMAALWRGDFDEARRTIGELEATARQHPLARDGIGGLAFVVGQRRAEEDYRDLPAVEAQLRASHATLYGDLGALICELLICQLRASAGDRAGTAAQLATIQAHPLFEAIEEATWLALLADPVCLVGDTALAARIYDRLLPRARWFFTFGPHGCYAEPPYAWQLGKLARLLGREVAAAHFAEALELTERAGMRPWIERLRAEVGPQPARPAATLAPAMAREGELWAITDGSTTLRLRDSRGLQVLERLLASPGEELHVLQLVGADDGEGIGGDAGELLDRAAIGEYRARLLELRETLDEAEERHDTGRAERARAEIDALTAELARAVGLGGRSRRAGGAAERARTTVQKRLRDAIRRIEDGLPSLGRHLDQSIRTGVFCGYLPGGRTPRRSS